MSEKTFPVQVVARSRPLTEKEKIEGSILSFPSNKEVCLRSKNLVKTYTFDRVYPPDSTQEDVYVNSISPIVNETLKGFNCTIFAYGQTGTGKTYTMEGHGNYTLDTSVELSPHAGIIPRAAHEIFEYLERSCQEFTVRVSFLELYNEELVDLLGTTMEPLKIFDDYTRKGITVYNLEEVPVANINDVAKILDRGLKKRQVAETNLNKTSSRSHCIFSIIIHTKESTPEGEDLLKVGKLNLVDLAGSENIGRSGAQDKRKREAGLINQSLLTLGRVITALTEHSTHIPYRESKLTRLLQDSLGGKTKTCIVATLSPSNGCFDETASTLDYAFRARNIRNKPEVNQKMTKKALIKEYVSEIEKLKKNLSAARDGSGFFVDKETYEDMEKQIQAAKDKQEELELELQGAEESLKKTMELFNEKEVELEKTSKLYSDTRSALDKTAKELQVTSNNLEEHKVLLEGHQLVIAEHEATEKILQENQTKLVQTLHETIYDVNGLHGKIDRKQTTEEENKRKISEFSKYLVKRFNSMDDRLKSLENEQASMNNNVTSILNNLSQNTQTEFGQFNEQLQQLNTLVQQCTSKMAELQNSSKSTVTENLDKISQLQDAHDIQVLHSMSHFANTANSAINQLKENVANEQKSIISILESTKSMLSTRMLAFTVGVDEIKQQLHAVQVETANLVEQQRIEAHSQEAQLDTIANSHQVDLLAFKENLMDQISLAMNSFIDVQNKKLVSSHQTLKQSIHSSTNNTNNLSNTLHNITKDINVKVMALSTEEHELNTKLVQETDNLHKPLDSIAKTSSVASEEISSSIDQIKKNVIEQNSIHTNNLHSGLSQAKEELSNCVVQSEHERKSLYDRYLVHTNELHTYSSKIVSSSENAENSLKSEITRNKEAVNSVQTTMCNDVGEVKRDVQRFFSTLKEDKVTGATPKKKKIEVAVSNPPIPQKEVIIAEFKKKMTIVDLNKENIVNN